MGRNRATEEGFDYKTYYENNKEEILKKRREKYKKDSSFRKRQRIRTANIYAKKKKRHKPVDKQNIKGYLSIGKVARLTGRSISQLRHYHKKGWIPEPTAFDSRGWRLYTKNQVNLLIHAFKNMRQRGLTVEKALEPTKEDWDA